MNHLCKKTMLVHEAVLIYNKNKKNNLGNGFLAVGREAFAGFEES